MTVELEFLLNEDTEPVTEGGLAAAIKELRGQKPLANSIVGGLFYRQGDVECRLFDEVTWVVTAMALEVVPEILDQGESLFSFWSFDGEVLFKQQGNEVELTSALFETKRFPADVFMIETLAAAARFIDILAAHWAGDESIRLDDLRTDLAAVRARLAEV